MKRVPSHQYEYERDMAAAYESLRVEDPKWQLENSAVRELLSLVAVHAARVLDVPVGTGRFLPLYEEFGLQVLGLDVSEDMLREARSRVSPTSHGIQLGIGDITRLELPTGSMQVSVCVRFANLVGFQTLQTALAELARVTDGYIVLGVRLHSRRGLLRRVIRKALVTVRGREQKLTIHSTRRFPRALESLGLTVEEKRQVHVAERSTSEYSIYLIKTRGTRTR